MTQSLFQVGTTVNPDYFNNGRTANLMRILICGTTLAVIIIMRKRKLDYDVKKS